MFFVLWYTDFGGPLSDEEIDTFVSAMAENDGDPQVVAFIETFAREDSGRQFLMVNNLDMNDDPPDVEGAAPGENVEHWTQAAVFRYRSRRSFLEIVTNPAFSGKHHFKTAALAKTIAYTIGTSLYLGTPGRCWHFSCWP